MSAAAAWYVAASLAAVYALWVFYLAVMNLKRVRDAGQLHRHALWLGRPVLVVGYVLDALVNVFVMTPLLWELPREATVSKRLKRHNLASKGWRKAVAVWFEPLLDPFDPSGDHI